MVRKIAKSFWIVALIFLAGVGGFSCRINENQVSPTTQSETTTLEELENSKVVKDFRMDILVVVLEGKIMEISGRTVVLAADGDTMSVLISQNAVISIPPPPGQPEGPRSQVKVSMEDLKIGKRIYILATYDPERDVLEGQILSREDIFHLDLLA